MLRALRPLCRPVCSSRAFAATSSSAKTRMEKITFGENLPGYVIGPKGAPGVIVLQEWWGITDEVKSQATKISEQGYRALLPDLYKGKIGVVAEEAKHLMAELDFNAAVGEIGQAAKFLLAEGSPKVGVVGFCMGGALALLAAMFKPDEIAACAPFYGIPGHPAFDASKIKCPVQGHFGQEDHNKGFSDPPSAHKLEAALKLARADNVVFIYPAVGHAFLNNSAEAKEKMRSMKFPTEGLEPAQKLAWERLFAFFAENLKQ